MDIIFLCVENLTVILDALKGVSKYWFSSVAEKQTKLPCFSSNILL